MAARQPAYLNIVKQEQGHGPTTECLAAVPVAVTNEETNRKPGMLSAAFTGVKRAAAPARAAQLKECKTGTSAETLRK